MTNILKRLIKFKTTKGNREELFACRDYIGSLFSEAQLHVRKFEQNDIPSIVVSNHTGLDLDLILCGHFDVVPANNSEFEPRIRKGRISGRGAIDMKGPDAAMISAMQQLESSATKAKVALMLTGDEEIGGFNGVKYLLDEVGYKSKVVFIPDGGLDFQLVTAEKGLVFAKISSKGKTAHGSRPWLGENAILRLFEVYNDIRTVFPRLDGNNNWGVSVNLGKIEGGDAVNKVPSEATMYLDIRFTEKYSISDIKSELQGVLDKYDNVKLEVPLTGPNSFTSENNDYFKRFKKIAGEITGGKIELTKGHGASDGRHFSKIGIPVIMTTCKGSGFHVDSEWVDASSMKILQTIISEFIKSLRQMQRA